ncbi:hypothetical protein ACFFIY_04825 [Bhargavaea ullalensis]|uniref:Uncharacterized protein n=1 Tax=Bhargavaea ullalensis TaxID=1265685 RepID=A0ABV2GAB4_9BACL
MEFIFLRPVYIVLLAALIVLGVLILSGVRAVNGLTLWSVVALASVTAAICLWQTGIIADELNLAGDEVSFYLAIAVWGLALFDIGLFLKKRLKPSTF